MPVAWRGEIGEYDGEDERPAPPEGRRGHHRLGGRARRRPVPARRRRATRAPTTIPGTEDDLDESMLLAPMLFEDARHRRHRARPSSASTSSAPTTCACSRSTPRSRPRRWPTPTRPSSSAAQSEALERQLSSQRELLRVTESILDYARPAGAARGDRRAPRRRSCRSTTSASTCTTRRPAVLRRSSPAASTPAAYRVGAWRRRGRRAAGSPSTARASSSTTSWPIPRVAHFDDVGPQAGALIVAPLRGRDGASRRPDARAPRVAAAVHDRGVRAGPAVRGAGLDRHAERGAHADVVVQAQTDGLTGLFNHATFTADLERAVASSERVRADHARPRRLQGLQRHARTPGRGPPAARASPVRLTSAGRDSDRAFRYGGDEFALLLPGADATGARAVADRVRRAVHDEGGLRGASGAQAVTCSTGVAAFPSRRRGRGGHPGCRRPSLLPGQARLAETGSPRPSRRRTPCRLRAQAPTPIDMPSCTEVGRLSGPPGCNASPVGTIAG